MKFIVKLLLIVILFTSSTCFASYYHHRHKTYYAQALTATDARDTILNTLHSKHIEAINWWVEYINDKVYKESMQLSSSITIDVSVATSEVQNFLLMFYERAGYHAELIPGWTGENTDHHGIGHPDGKTYLGLSW